MSALNWKVTLLLGAKLPVGVGLRWRTAVLQPAVAVLELVLPSDEKLIPSDGSITPLLPATAGVGPIGRAAA